MALAASVADYQLQMGCLHSNEQPKGSMLTDVKEWIQVFGIVAEPVHPWVYHEVDGCMLRAEYPGVDNLGAPMMKPQYWVANFDLSPMEIRRKAPQGKALCASGHAVVGHRSGWTVATTARESDVCNAHLFRG